MQTHIIRTLGLVTIIIICIFIMVGCVNKRSSGKVNIPELGLFMNLPSGWRVDKRDPRMFLDAANPDDNFGMVEIYPLKGKTLAEFLEENIGEIRTISKITRRISGFEAIEIVTEAEYTVIEVNIGKGDEVIRVSFRTLKTDFPKFEASFRSALQSIEIR